MTIKTQALSPAGVRYLPAILVAVLGVTLITLTGHVQAGALHDAAHDVRHATDFPCH